MTRKLEEKLFYEFDFYKKYNENSCMLYGFQCNDGWYNLIYKLSSELKKYIRKNRIDSFEVMQVKEKLGTLRYYFRVDTSKEHTIAIESIVVKYKIKSSSTCEDCGSEKAKMRRDLSRVATLCKKCYTETKREDPLTN